jgi:dethiobiotin synthetase
MACILFITGTDTGVGKTVITSWLARHLRSLGLSVAALKPVGSGGRDDARALHAALGGALSLDEINPWHFRASLAPLLAARLERRKVTKAQVVAHIRRMARRFEIVLVEGAGGPLSPLGERFDSRNLIVALQAKPIVVAQNRLGAVNQVRLVLAALPAAAARRAEVVLVNPRRPDAASRSNPGVLAEFVPARRLHGLPWLEPDQIEGRKPPGPAVSKILDRLAQALFDVMSVMS